MIKNNPLKKIKFFLLAVIGIAAIVIFAKYLNTYLHKSKAAGNATLTISPSSGNHQVNQPFNVTYRIQANDSSKKITAINLNFTTTGNLAILGIRDPVYIGGTGTLNKIKKDVGQNSAKLIYNTQSNIENIANAISLTFTLKGTSPGSGRLITSENYEVTASPPPVSLNFDISNPSFTFAGAAEEGATATLQIKPANISSTKNSNFSVSLKLDSNLTTPNQGITAFKTRIEYDKNIISAKSIQSNNVVLNDFNKISKPGDTISDGNINLIFLLKSSVTNHPKGGIEFTIKFHAKNRGQSDIKINPDRSITDIAGDKPIALSITNGKAIISSIVPTNTPTPTERVSGCSTDSECLSHQVCREGVCVAAPNTGCKSLCKTDANCQEGLVCNHYYTGPYTIAAMCCMNRKKGCQCPGVTNPPAPTGPVACLSACRGGAQSNCQGGLVCNHYYTGHYTLSAKCCSATGRGCRCQSSHATNTPAPPTIIPTSPISTLTQPTNTPTPTEESTICSCQTNNTCSSNCGFTVRAMNCGIDSAPRNTTPSQNDKNSYCQRPKRTQGDADGNGIIDLTDYAYYLNAMLSRPLPPSVNTDFNGDGHTDYHDFNILKQALGE